MRKLARRSDPHNCEPEPELLPGCRGALRESPRQPAIAAAAATAGAAAAWRGLIPRQM